MLLAGGPMALALLAGGAAFAVFGLAGGGPAVTVSGSLELTDYETRYGPDNCAGRGGFADISAGTQVVVTDGAGETIGVGSLTAGSPAGRENTCRYYFAVREVPGDLDFYGIEVSHRGRVQYPRAALNSPVVISLG